ncbi:MAG: thioredoxin domain-containing protein [Alphaproteobacteria bacterium]|nr:thioredoxin domain-containing protein [Alphaproteobacteria bacterium]
MLHQKSLIVVLATVLATAVLTACGPSSTQGGEEALKIAPDDHTLGSPTAPVTLIEYAAPSCPVCAAFDEQVFPQLKSTYIDTGKVHYVFRVFPLRPADGAAEAIARCLPKDSYMDFIQLLFRRQADWDPEFGVQDAHAGLLQIAHVAGISSEKADQCIQDKDKQKRINEIAAAGAAQFQISATPTVIIDGKVQASGFIPWDQLQKSIEDALKKAPAPSSTPH